MLTLHNDSENEPLFPASFNNRLNPVGEEEDDDNQSTVVNVDTNNIQTDGRQILTASQSDESRQLLGATEFRTVDAARQWLKMERFRLKEDYLMHNGATITIRDRYIPDRLWRRYVFIILDLMSFNNFSAKTINMFIETWINSDNFGYITRRIKKFTKETWMLMWQMLLELVISLIEALPTVNVDAISALMNQVLGMIFVGSPEKILTGLENIQDMLDTGELWTASEHFYHLIHDIINEYSMNTTRDVDIDVIQFKRCHSVNFIR